MTHLKRSTHEFPCLRTLIFLFTELSGVTLLYTYTHCPTPILFLATLAIRWAAEKIPYQVCSATINDSLLFDAYQVYIASLYV
jgi:hypothetical protein